MDQLKARDCLKGTLEQGHMNDEWNKILALFWEHARQTDSKVLGFKKEMKGYFRF